MKMPNGLGYQGQKLWKTITAEFNIETEPHKQRILFDAAKLADNIDRLDKAADTGELIVKGSYGQPVVNPCLTQAQTARNLLAQLLSRLNFEGNPSVSVN